MKGPTRRQLLGCAAVAAGPVAPGRLFAGAAGEAKNRFGGAFSADRLARVLLPRARWRPFPTAAERAPWERIPQDVRAALVEAGVRGLEGPWPSLPATVVLEVVRTGNRSHYESMRGARRGRLGTLVLAECLEAKGRFLDEILNGIWLTCEETFWGVSAHIRDQKAGPGLPDVEEPMVDLFAAETAGQLAWTDYLLGPGLEKLSPLLPRRIRVEVDRRVLTPCLTRDDFKWMALLSRVGLAPVNNWNPWINSNWLTAALLLESDEKRRTAAVHKILRSLDGFIDGYPVDGSCDEGPGYWNEAAGSLFDCLDLLHSASAGAVDFFKLPLVAEMGRFIYRAHIADDRFVNFGDASARQHLQADLVYRFGERIGDARMQALAADKVRRGTTVPVVAGADPPRPERRLGLGRSMGRQLHALFNLATLRAARGGQPLLRDVWLSGIELMTARRKEGAAAGLFLAAQGGHNAQSHNHNDVGNFIVYADGRPVIIDVGVETYTAKTFSPQRYEIWTMQSAYHNLPTIDGVLQQAGRQYAARGVAYHADVGSAELKLDIAGAYPPEAGLVAWKRTLRLDRARNHIDVVEDYALSKRAGKITLSLMTCCRVTDNGRGELTLESNDLGALKVRASFDPRTFSAKVEPVSLKDSSLRGAWGDTIYRILLVAAAPPLAATWRVSFVQS